MKFLIIGDTASMHIYNYVKHVLAGTQFEVTLFSTSNRSICDEYKAYYKENNVEMFDIYSNNNQFMNSGNAINRLRKFINKYKMLKSLGRFDIAQLQFVNISGSIYLYLLRKQFTKIILTFWGSDILQLNKKDKFIQRFVLPTADYITLFTEEMIRKFRHEYGIRYDSKIYKVNTIDGVLPNIKNIYLTEGVLNAKSYFALPVDKIVIMCGYNGSQAQQQDELIKLISTMNISIKRKVHIIMPFMYGCTNKKYIDEVRLSLKNSDITYTIIENYLNYNDMARLSIATDIYIHVRFTDALSTSMQEQLYAGSVMIRGSWLKYHELDDADLPIYKIDHLNEIPGVLTEITTHLSNIKREPLSQFIWDMSSGVESRRQSFQIWNKDALNEDNK